MEKRKFYVNLGTQEISQIHNGNNDIFTIYATPEEVIKLREAFDEVYKDDVGAFLRAHVPFVEYHNDKPNDRVDSGLEKIISMIQELGDEKTREFISSIKSTSGDAFFHENL
ncbi:hydrolase [Bacillaceae bacterium S4-13-58]